ncbi:MAG: DUF3179 domain-containing protein [Saprospiraceae bacterium]|nr:DUF3179 domain-containing protein [Saprospiraceae bacterium]
MINHKSNHYFSVLFFIGLLALPLGCAKQSDPIVTGSIPISNPDPQDTEWLIPREKVIDGGPGKDGIPSIDDPNFSDINTINFLKPDDLILGVKVGNVIRGYPHPILDWHEIVNDQINGIYLAITYCPLTGTGIAWNRDIDERITTLGVSGLLYNTNLIPYDRISGSNWSQMLLSSVNGPLKGVEAEIYPLIETTWETWKTRFPESKILNTSTGFNKSYGYYPYGDYKTNENQLLFPISHEDYRLPRKTRGLGLLSNNHAKFYPLQRFKGQVRIINDFLNGTHVVVAGSERENWIIAYQAEIDGKLLKFEADVDNSDQIIMSDDQGNRWNIFGEAVSGPLLGVRLKTTNSYMGFWFAWATFYPGIHIL